MRLGESVDLAFGEGHARKLTAGTLRLLQLSDTHILADPRGRLVGQETRRTFEAVLELARTRFWPPDLILLTGDLGHGDGPTSYRYLAQRMRDLNIPYACIAGNHDQPDLLAEFLDPGARLPVRSLACGAWRLILLNSSHPNAEGGHLTTEQLQSLRQLLAEDGRPTLIGLHHQPVPVGCAWLDQIGLDNGPELMRLVARERHVRAVLWGHVHQAHEARQQDCLLLSAPSTCIQFRPLSKTFALDTAPPGLRWLTLSPDGGIASGIARLDGYPRPLDLDSGGY